MEHNINQSLYKIELYWIKIIPMLLAAFSFTDTILSYIGINTEIIAYINAIVVWLFLFLSSIIFKFCKWHRLFLYYILTENLINAYDCAYTIPLDLKNMIVVQLMIILIFITLGLYFHLHDKQ